MKCKNCGSMLFEYKEKPPHIGAYCKVCGKWQKWLNKVEKDLYNTATSSITTTEQHIDPPYVDDYDDVPW